MTDERAADEPAALRARVGQLNEQVKLLVKTEQRLYAAQRQVETQLHRIDALNHFALVAPSTYLEPEILRSAFDLLWTSVPMNAAVAVLKGEDGAPLLLVRAGDRASIVDPRTDEELGEALARCEPPADDVLLFDRAGGDAVDVPLLRWLDRRHPGPDPAARGLRRSAIALALRAGTAACCGLLVGRSETVSFHERVASEPDRAFLKLVCRHVNAALTIARSRQGLERRVEQRTHELAAANTELETRLSELRNAQQQLLETSRKAGMADVATSVLHNVGNILNSINVSAELAAGLARSPNVAGLGRAMALLRAQPDPRRFLADDHRGTKLIEYLDAIADAIESDRARMVAELDGLTRNVDHIKVIVSLQQSHAKRGGVIERLTLPELIEDALRVNAASYDRHGVEIARDYQERSELEIDRHKLFQIVMNLLSNARQAVQERPHDRHITVRTRQLGDGAVEVEVEDNGVGIAGENLEKIFSHGFTTRRDGHGFGLHSSACAAVELGGTLSVHSDGLGRGARFTVVLPRVATG